MKTYITECNRTRCAGPRVDAHSFEEAQEAIDTLYGDAYTVLGELVARYPVDPQLIQWMTTPSRVSDNVAFVEHCHHMCP